MKCLYRALIFFFLLLTISCNTQTTTPTLLSETPENTKTPKPTSSPTTSPSPAPEEVSIEFPEWVKNPDTQILLFPFTQKSNVYKNLALINAKTAERFDIPYTEKVGDYFWSPDGQQIGFLPNNTNLLSLFSIKDGKVHLFNLENKTLRFLRHSTNVETIIPFLSTSSDFTNPNLELIPFLHPISPDNRYFLLIENCSKSYFCIYDAQENELVDIFKINSETVYLFSEISPDSKYVAVVEVDKAPGLYFTFDEEPTFRLQVYDIAAKKLFTSYKNITSADWSPDGQKFLYTQVEHQEYYSFLGTSPCIFDTLSGDTKCFKISNIAYPNWSPDQKSLSFISNNKSKGFCIIQLISEQQKCILRKLDNEDQMLINYTWSPDSHFIVFAYDTSCPYCDYRDRPEFGIADISTGNYFSIDYTNHYFEPGLWRPSQNP